MHGVTEQSVHGRVDHAVLLDERFAGELWGMHLGFEVIVAAECAHPYPGSGQGLLDPLPDLFDTDHWLIRPSEWPE